MSEDDDKDKFRDIVDREAREAPRVPSGGPAPTIISVPKAVAASIGCGILPFLMNLSSTLAGQFDILNAMAMAFTAIFAAVIYAAKNTEGRRNLMYTILVAMSFSPLIGWLFP